MTYDPNRPTTHSATERELDRTANQAQGTVEAVRDKAEDLADDVKERAAQVGSQVADRADAATTAVGERMADAATTIRQKAPSDGPLADAADTAADTLQRAGTYLQEQDLSDMRADLEGLIRRHPIEAMLIGFGVGYLLARSTRR
jgi:ABC-type transporter Mla subunit MlaD